MDNNEKQGKLQELGKEYSQLCASLGEIIYQNKMYEGQVTDLIGKLKYVNKKAADLNKGASDEQRTEEPVQPKES